MVIGILVRTRRAPRGSPGQVLSTRWIAEWSEETGHRVVYFGPGDLEQEAPLCISGWSPELHPDRWVACEKVRLDAIYNRFPRNQDVEGFDRIVQVADRAGVPFANRPELQGLVWDKWQTFELLEQAGIRTPATVRGVSDWQAHLARWGSLYSKPRFGAFGEGICRFSPASQEPGAILREGPAPGEREVLDASSCDAWLRGHARDFGELLCQEGIVSPFAGYRGCCIRTLLQREGLSGWVQAPHVARVSVDDPVANVERGARALPLSDLCEKAWDKAATQSLLAAVRAQNTAVAELLAASLPAALRLSFLELGVDTVLDAQAQPWILEVNGFPQGKLSQLAAQEPDRFQTHAQRLHLRPLRTLIQLLTSA